MRRSVGSRKRISFDQSKEIIRPILLLCILGSVAAFAATRDRIIVLARPRVQATQPAPNAPDTQTRREILPAIKLSPEPPVSSQDTDWTEPRSLASAQSLSQENSFRLLWIAAALGLILVLRRQRPRRT